MRFLLLSAVLCGVAACAGCVAPVVEIHHQAPADIVIPSNTHVTEVRASGPGDGLAREHLRSRLECMFPAGGGKPAATIEADVRIDFDQSAGERQVRLLEPRKELASRPLATLKQSLGVSCRFLLSRQGEPPVVIAAAAHYRSVDDPRVRGELGLTRGDDPAKIPPFEQVLRETLDDCLSQLSALAAAPAQHSRIRLRYDMHSLTGFSQVAKGHYAQAAAALARQASRHPDNKDLLFNLAVVEERLGLWADAIAHYQRVLDLSEGEDIEAQRQLRIVKAMSIRQEMESSGLDVPCRLTN